jgi:hypothetical protein
MEDATMTEQLPEQQIAATTTLEIPGVPEEQIQQLDERARQAGVAPAEYVRSLIMRELERPSLDEILAPIRQGFAESGLTEDELTALFEEARDEAWEERQREGRT